MKATFNSYFLKSQDFVIPILEHLYYLVHKACPDVEEALKWSFPHFLYKGKILCSMASFKEHCAFGFWLAPVMKDPDKIFMRDKEGVESALSFFDSLSTIQKNEYTNWILEAKQESTKERRIVQMIEQLSEAKTRNWKYER